MRVEASRASAAPVRSLAELAVLAAYLVFVPALFEAALNGFGIRAEGLTQVIGTSILYGGFVSVAILLVKLRGQALADIGLKRPPNLARSAFLGLAVAALFFVAIEMLMRTHIMTRDSSVLPQWRNNVVLLLAWIAMITILTGVIEELIYRGFVMDRIANALGSTRFAWVAACIGQAILFGLAHAYGNLQLILFAGAFAIAYAALYLADGRSLLAPIVAHVAYDVARVLFRYYLATYGDPFVT